MTRTWLSTSLVIAALCLAVPADAQWETPNRGFHKDTGFPLEGRHLSVPCESCHLNGVYKGTPTTCYDCHWIRRQDDRYQTQLGMQCEQCHRPTAWTPARWDHAAQANLALGVAHRLLACDSCHRDGRFQGAIPTCESCHLKDYQATSRLNHAAAGFPLTCQICHLPSDVSFDQARFDHSAAYPLVGVHATRDCQSCHGTGVYQGTPRDCVGCHRADYDRAQNPNHAAAGFPTGCESCHRPTDPNWQSAAGFNHNSVFRLVGVHASRQCQDCHRNGVYAGTPRDCVGCHRTDYERAQSPNHVSAGFPTSCDTCHRPTDPDWDSGGSFDHNRTFPLLGVHATQACQTCHVNNVYRGTPRDCVGCHRAEYDRTQNPNHAAAGFPTTCDSCHRATDPSWQTAGFNHNSVFPLVGVHATRPCAECHVNNVYRGTPRNCVGCHRSDYDRARDPNHVSAGFPTTCDSCHRATDSSWSQGTFNHTWFPITSGPHGGRACADCHPNPSSYAVFSCTTCHDRSQTDNKHREVSAYRYDSAACYSCHPNGRE